MQGDKSKSLIAWPRFDRFLILQGMETSTQAGKVLWLVDP
jgi:hypothetical protein